MSLDYNKAKEDVQRIIDNSTGAFKDDFKNPADDFVKVAQESEGGHRDKRDCHRGRVDDRRYRDRHAGRGQFARHQLRGRQTGAALLAACPST